MLQLEKYVTEGSHLRLKEKKTGKSRDIYITAELSEAIRRVVQHRDDQKANTEDYVFVCENRTASKAPLSSRSFIRLVKHWCKSVGLAGNFGTHSLRKSFGYHLRISGASISVIQKAYNHSNQAVTLSYLGIDQDDIDDLMKSVKY